MYLQRYSKNLQSLKIFEEFAIFQDLRRNFELMKILFIRLWSIFNLCCNSGVADTTHSAADPPTKKCMNLKIQFLDAVASLDWGYESEGGSDH